MIYHLLGDTDVFSAYRGNAIARNVANMMRFDSSRVVVCAASDSTWGYSSDRIVVVPELRISAKIPGKYFLPNWIMGLFFRWVFRSLLARLKENDIIWCHNQPIFCAALEKTVHAKKAKLIYHAHNSVTSYSYRSKFKFFTADALIFVSEALRQETLKFLPKLKNTFAVHNGADETLFYPSAATNLEIKDAPVILFVGRLHPTKGVHVLLKAMKILEARKINAVCKVVGSSAVGGSKSTHYVQSLYANCPSNVHFAPYQSGREIANEYRAADIFCCPSIWQEPFGNINIEAMACGISVVATRVGGIPEIAAEGGVVLVEPNSATELADALQKLVEDKNLRTSIAAEGLKSFRQRFTWSKITSQYRKVVETMYANVTKDVLS
jgi:spore coat protein SA